MLNLIQVNEWKFDLEDYIWYFIALVRSRLPTFEVVAREVNQTRSVVISLVTMHFWPVLYTLPSVFKESCIIFLYVCILEGGTLRRLSLILLIFYVRVTGKWVCRWAPGDRPNLFLMTYNSFVGISEHKKMVRSVVRIILVLKPHFGLNGPVAKFLCSAWLDVPRVGPALWNYPAPLRWIIGRVLPRMVLPSYFWI